MTEPARVPQRGTVSRGPLFELCQRCANTWRRSASTRSTRKEQALRRPAGLRGHVPARVADGTSFLPGLEGWANSARLALVHTQYTFMRLCPRLRSHAVPVADSRAVIRGRCIVENVLVPGYQLSQSLCGSACVMDRIHTLAACQNSNALVGGDRQVPSDKEAFRCM